MRDRSSASWIRRIEVASIVSLVDPSRNILTPAVDAPSPLHRGTGHEGVRPAQNVSVLVARNEIDDLVGPALNETSVPRQNRDVGDAVVGPGDIFAIGKTTIEHIELALYFHGEAIDGVLDLEGRVDVEVPEASADIGRTAHLPEEPVEHFGASGKFPRKQRAELFREIEQNRAGLEDLIGSAPLWSIMAGTFEFGLSPVKPLPN
jgi:hypothetical protein